MLDEPSMGLAPAIADFIFDRLMEIRRESNLTILLVEQRVAEALQFADHGYVLETGRVVLEGDSAALRANDRVRQAYLGMRSEEHTSELQSLMRISYAVFCLKKKNKQENNKQNNNNT